MRKHAVKILCGLPVLALVLLLLFAPIDPNYVLFAAELVGTFAFAFSGAVVALQKNLDLFGTLVLGVITAVGGGYVRDLSLGVTPPALFRNSIYVIVAVATSLLVFLLCYFRILSVERLHHGTYSQLLNTMDAIGLGIFTVVGVNTAVGVGYGTHGFFLSVTVGTITGIGGGILRDVLAVRMPVVLHKHIYAVASIAGASVYYLLLPRVPDNIALVVSSCLVISIRLLATHFEWNLPKIPQ